MTRTQLLIGGRWVNGSDGETFAVTDPSSGEELARVSSGTAADVTAAVTAAAAAQGPWACCAPRVRSEILRACWQSLTDHVEELAELIVREHGKPLSDARGEIAYAAEFFRWNAEEAVRLHGTLGTAPSGANRVIVRHPPVGVVVMITPWNFPAAMITRKVAPALAAGNSVVIKPAPDTPLTALRIAELLEAAGVPPGVVNVVPTARPQEWFDAAIAHRATRMFSFTGSTGVGKTLLAACAGRVLKVAMELGGNAPFIVLKDADLSAAVSGAMVAKMRHSAETCVAANRFFVEQGVAEEFTSLLAASMSAVKVGNGFVDGVGCGPLINETALLKTERLVKTAVDDGGVIVTGGHRVDGPGWFYEPTVIGGVRPGAAVTHEELFAPVATVVSFDDSEQMLSWANDTEMGLAGYLYGGDLGRCLSMAERLQCGMVGINRGFMSDPAAPFGGMKQSGLGREGGAEGIYEFCETQYIAAEW